MACYPCYIILDDVYLRYSCGCNQRCMIHLDKSENIAELAFKLKCDKCLPPKQGCGNLLIIGTGCTRDFSHHICTNNDSNYTYLPMPLDLFKKWLGYMPDEMTEQNIIRVDSSGSIIQIRSVSID